MNLLSNDFHIRVFSHQTKSCVTFEVVVNGLQHWLPHRKTSNVLWLLSQSPVICAGSWVFTVLYDESQRYSVRAPMQSRIICNQQWLPKSIKFRIFQGFV